MIAAVRPPAGAAGVVEVRLSGDMPALAALATLLATHPAIGILTGPDGPRANRREPGSRVYLTVRVPIRSSAGAGAPLPGDPPPSADPPARRAFPS